LTPKGEIKALPLVGRTPERESLFDFTFPYLSLHGAIVVPEGTTDIHDLNDLRGRRVAVMKGDNAEEFLRRTDLGIEIHTTPTFKDALRELSGGNHDAVIIQRLLALRIIQLAKITNLKIVDKPLEDLRQDFCFAVKEGDKETLSLLNEGLALVMADGIFNHLQTKWFATLELSSDNHLVIGGDHNYPPYEFLDENGQPAGYNVELTRAIAQNTGLDIEIRLGLWSDIRQGLASGEIDAIQGMFYSLERDLQFDFSPPHTAINHIAVVRKGEGSPPIHVADFAGKRIVVMYGDIMHEWVEEKGIDAQISVVATHEDALRELTEGQHDCALVARVPAMYWIKKNGWNNLVVADKPLLTPEYCYAVPHNRKMLLATLSEGLKSLDDSGEYQRIYAKWMGVYEETPPSLAIILRYTMIVVAPLLLILFASFIWMRTLKNVVKRRTSDLQENEEALKQSELQLAESQRIAHLGNWILDAQSDELQWSDETFRIFGLIPQESEITNTTFINFIHPDDREHLQKVVKNALDNEVHYKLDHRIIRKDGEIRFVHEEAEVSFDEDGNPIKMVGTVQDITESKHLENQLRQSQKMEAIGQLAGGVAHDFNNILMVILGYANFIIDKEDIDEKIQSDAMEIKNAANRAKSLTRQLLAFSRKQVLQSKVINLNELITNLKNMLTRLIGEDVELITTLSPELGQVTADPGQIEQVIMNLAVNARDAMPTGGALVIETANVYLDQNYAKNHPDVKPGNFVMLAISDTGQGMTKEITEQIFDPFFTTKEQGKGTGLGLSTVYGIVKQSGGNIWVYSEPDQGTSFKIYLTQTDQEIQSIKNTQKTFDTYQGSEKILVVEDEKAVRDIVIRVLRKLGYTVIESTNGDEAIQECEKHHGQIDLLLTDVIMPKMSGKEVSNIISSKYSNIKTLYMSGYTDNIIVHHGVLDEGFAFIQKPIAPEELAHKIREVLDTK